MRAELHFSEDFSKAPDRFGSIRGLSTSGFHKIAYTDWGTLDASSTVVCVHGLSRQGRDFDKLASALSQSGYRVVCPDLPGRGNSDWMPNVLDYVFPQYCADMATLLASLGPGPIHWIGTSLGGLIGIVLAGAANSPITKLIVNDIGPDVPLSAVARVGLRISRDPTSFSSFDDALQHHRRTFASCGPLSDEQWRHFTKFSLRTDEAGRYVSLLDPKVITAYSWLMYYQMTLWSYWDAIKTPIMAIRGVNSDFLPAFLLGEMKRRAPQLVAYEVADTGHMPMLMSAQEIDAVTRFLKME